MVPREILWTALVFYRARETARPHGFPVRSQDARPSP